MLTRAAQRRLYSPDAGDAFVKNLELSGEPCLPMTGWAVRTAEGLENLTLQQVWNWTVRRNVFRQAYHDGASAISLWSWPLGRLR